LATELPGNHDSALPFDETNDGDRRMLRGNLDTHLHLISHHMHLNNLTLLLTG